MNKDKNKPENNKAPYFHDCILMFDAKAITTDENKDYTSFRGLAQKVDYKNDNNRIYTNEAIEEALPIVKDKIAKGRCNAQAGHQFCGDSFGEAGAIITKVERIGDEIWIEGKFIKNTTYRDKLKPYLDAGGTIGLSVKGYCTNYMVNPHYDEEKQAWIFGKGYRIEGWDFVTNPALDDAEVKFMESLQQQRGVTQDNATQQSNNMKGDSKMDFKTLAELQANFPHLFVDSNNKMTELEKQAKLYTDSVNTVKTLQEENAKLKAANDAMSAEIKTVKDSFAAVEAELTQTKFKTAVDSILKDNKYAKHITVPAGMTKIEDAKAFIEAETKKFDALLAENTKEAKDGKENKEENKEVKDAKVVKETIVPEKPATPAPINDAEEKARHPYTDAWKAYGDKPKTFDSKTPETK